MIIPVDSPNAWISCRFGWRKNPFLGKKREFHNGLDISAEWKTPILAAADGKVVKAGKDRFLGNYVRIEHSKKHATIYGHLNKLAAKKRHRVRRGDVIGYMGNSGRSTGTHLHYCVIKDDHFVNPIDFIWDRFGNKLVVNQF